MSLLIGNNDSHSLKLGYADFIVQYPWDVYSTITYRCQRKDSLQWSLRAWSMFERFDATRAVVAVEPHRLDGIHLHCLSTHWPSLPHLSSLWKYSYKAFGRSQIEWVDDPVAVSRYCAKYVVKENDVFLFGDKNLWNAGDVP